MAKVVRQGDGLGQVLVESEAARDGAADLGDFEGVRQACAVVVVGLGDEYLRFVHEPTEGGRVDDAVAVALIEGAKGVLLLGVTTSAALARAHGVGGQHFVFAVEPVGRLERSVVRHEGVSIFGVSGRAVPLRISVRSGGRHLAIAK